MKVKGSQVSKRYPAANKTIQKLLQSRQMFQQFFTVQFPGSAIALPMKETMINEFQDSMNWGHSLDTPKNIV